MVINWGFHAIIAAILSTITCFSSIIYNTWKTSLIWSGLGFLLFFVLSIFFQFILHQVISKTIVEKKALEVNDERKSKVEEISANDSFQSIPLHSLHNAEE
jgi:energy-coupling factor transporter transmembrane protein EcfT